MIRDARALRDEFVPGELHHRNSEIEHISSCLQPIQAGRQGDHLLITGPSGAGKTTLAKHVCNELERETLDVRTGYANCISNSTALGVLHSLLRDAGIRLDIKRNTAPIDRYYDRLRGRDEQVVFIIDEVDVLEDQRLLAALHEQQGVTMIMVCVDEDAFLADAGMRIKSRVGGATSIRLKKYHDSEIVDIVAGRVDAGLRLGAADSETLQRIADYAAGDARLAITLLRRAAEKAELQEQSSLSPGLIDSVTDSATTEVHRRNVECLSTHQRHLYEIISEHEELSASTLHAEYEQRVDRKKAKSTRRRYLDSLERYDLIEKIGATRGTRYRSVLL